jgi:hypothetical protein
MTQHAATPAEADLRELVERHRISYRVLPEWGPDVRSGHQQKVGFDLELYGSATPGRSPTDDSAWQASFEALRAVAAWAFESGESDVCVAIDEGGRRIAQEPKLDEWVVQLSAHVVHCGEGKGPTDERERRYLESVKGRLVSLGVRSQ